MIQLTPAQTQAILFTAVLIALFYLLFMIRFGVGFGNLKAIHKTFMGRNKGWGNVYMIYPTGVRERVAVQFTGQSFIEPLGKGKGQYKVDEKLLKSNRDEYGFNFLQYRVGDYDPIDPSTGLVTLGSAELVEEAMSINMRAKNSLAGIWDKIKVYVFIAVGIFALVVIGLLWVINGQTETMGQMAVELTRPVIANLTEVGA